MRTVVILIGVWAALAVLLWAANVTPILTGTGYVKFPENSPAASLNASSGTLILNSPTGASLKFRINNSDIANVSANGLAVNATGSAASYTLDVDGNINFTGSLLASGSSVPTTPGTGLSASGATLNSNAVFQISYQPGFIAGTFPAKAAFSRVSKNSTVDNLIGSAENFSCSGSPVVSFYECGVSATCASPTTIGTVTVTAAGQAFAGSISSSAITAGDYVAWATSSGTCTGLDIVAVAQAHSN